MDIIITIILMIITVFGYVLLGRTKYLYIVFILILFRVLYWVLLGIEEVWEIGHAAGKLIDGKSLYDVYPWRHRILFDVIPVIETLIPFIIYFMAKDKNAINHPINVRVRQNNTRRHGSHHHHRPVQQY